MDQTWLIIWLVIFVILVVVEMITTGVTAVWFGVGALGGAGTAAALVRVETDFKRHSSSGTDQQ